MAVRAGRVFTSEWARARPYYFLSSFLAPDTRALPCAAPGSASFCTDAENVMSSRVKIFDRDLKRKQRDRAAWLMGGRNDFVDSVADNLLDRLEVLRLLYSLREV